MNNGRLSIPHKFIHSSHAVLTRASIAFFTELEKNNNIQTTWWKHKSEQTKEWNRDWKRTH
jgi:isopenicillin N synthase-like dioxygenase